MKDGNRSPAWLTILLCLGSFLSPMRGEAGTEIRVSILSVLAPVEVTATVLQPSTAWIRVEGDAECDEQALAGKIPVRIRLQKHMLYWIEQRCAVRRLEISCPGGCRIRLEIPGKLQREYSGNVIFSPGRNTINIVLLAFLEDLTGSVAVSEMSGIREPEAMRAFTVLSRSFLSTGNRHPEEQADVCDTTHCQVYQGRPVPARIRRLVQSTERLVLLYRSRPFPPYYSRSCGGTTATHQEVWGRPSQDYPYSSVPCPCAGDPHIWTYDLTFEQLATITGLRGGELQRDNSPVLLIRNTTRFVEFLPEQFRILSGRIIGWDKIRSNRFDMERSPSGYLLRGIGYGHGAGFCQSGASVLAKQGNPFEQILLHYFPNAEISEWRQ